MFIETNPVPAKYVLSVLCNCVETLRLPLVPIEPATEQAVLAAAKAVGLEVERPGARR